MRRDCGEHGIPILETDFNSTGRSRTNYATGDFSTMTAGSQRRSLAQGGGEARDVWNLQIHKPEAEFRRIQ